MPRVGGTFRSYIEDRKYLLFFNVSEISWRLKFWGKVSHQRLLLRFVSPDGPYYFNRIVPSDDILVYPHGEQKESAGPIWQYFTDVRALLVVQQFKGYYFPESYVGFYTKKDLFYFKLLYNNLILDNK